MKDIRGQLKKFGLDAMLFSNMNNIYYLCGFKGTAGQLFVTENGAFLITDFRYLSQAKEQTENVTVVDVAEGEKSIYDRLTKESGAFKIGFEQKHITYDRFLQLKKIFEGKELFSVKDMTEEMRIVKTDAEIASVRRACEIADSAFEAVLPHIKEGVAELEIAALIEYEMKKAGATGAAFETIVASGKRSAMPHGTASTKKLAAGEFVVMDFGCVFEGYLSDITRTVAVGDISDKMRDIYMKVQAVQEEMLPLVKPGIKCSEVDAESRRMFKTWGIDKYFGHSLGHGVGLDIHELPNLSVKSPYTLEKNMVVTVEPGIYIEGEFGVRIEDTVSVGEKGAERLTKSDKYLRICR